ncbi:MAG TPA: hypothetical protein VF815_10130 [Myxococcaceae bacterium]|jgi:hypothetical protein
MASDDSAHATRFFVLDKLLGGTHDTEFSTIDLKVGPASLCPQCGDPLTFLTWQPPHQGELELHGQEFGDLVDGPSGGLLVTERFAEAFKAEGLTGLSGFHPVKVLRVKRKRRGSKPPPPPPYVFVMPAHGLPALDMERSRLWIGKPMKCIWCRYTGIDAIDGLALELATWSGEDVFRPRGLWGRIIVTERFMRFAERYAVSHMTFVPIEKYVWDPLGLYYPREQQLEPPTKG